MRETSKQRPASVLDATRAHYLGIRHGAAELAPWRSLTTGRPAVLDPHLHASLRDDVASVIGTPAALLATSSLHGLIDALVAVTSPGTDRIPSTQLFVDEHLYPIARLAAHSTGIMPRKYKHFDSDNLCQLLGTHTTYRPVVVVDGSCPTCARQAPLRAFADIVAARNGLLIIDDTASFGLIGPCGGGTVAMQTYHPSMVVVSSAAKAFGAPIAVIGGSRSLIDIIASRGPMSSHGSPPSAAAAASLANALRLNATTGDARRTALRQNVTAFRNFLEAETGRIPDGGFGPIQSVPHPQATREVRALRDLGIAAVATTRRCKPGTAVTVVVRADHTRADVLRLATTLVRSLMDQRRRA